MASALLPSNAKKGLLDGGGGGSSSSSNSSSSSSSRREERRGCAWIRRRRRGMGEEGEGREREIEEKTGWKKVGGDGGTARKRKDERRVLTSDSPLSPRKLRIGCPFQSTCPAPRPAPPFCCPILPSLPPSLPLYFSTLFELPPPHSCRKTSGCSLIRIPFSFSPTLSLSLSRKPNPVVIFYVTRFAMNIDARGIKEGTVFRN